MFRLILRQANWGVLGSIFGFSVGFFVKIYLIDIVGLESWGKYAAAQTFSSICETILSLGIPFIIIRFFPMFVEKNISKASRIANLFLKYSFITGLCFLLILYFSADFISSFFYRSMDDFSLILFFMCLHIPISLLFGVIISLYRSVLKIKEIVLYGTVISVSVRALLTFIVFYFVSDIIYFIIIEVFIQVFILLFLLYLFNKNEFRLFVKSNVIECTSDSEMVNYGKKMFLTSFVSFISAHILSFIISITLSASDIGAYNILLTLTGLSTFLLINLNKVFAPAISKLYSSNNFFELNKLYKKTTFLINLITVPFVVTIAFFADEILSLYTLEMVEYKEHLFFMLVGGLLSLTAGSSGTLMVMAGLEKSNLYVQFSRALLLIILSFIFIPFFKMKAVVILYTLFMFFVNFIQVLLLNKHLNISPFSNELVFIIVITFFAMTFAIIQDYEFSFLHFIIIPISLYLFYFSIMYKPFKRILNQLK